MLDPRRLRAEPEAVAAQLARRGFVLDLDRFRALESARKQIQTETEKLQAERNAGSKRIGQAKAKGEDASPILADMDRIKSQLAQNEAQLASVQAEFDEFAQSIPDAYHIMDEVKARGIVTRPLDDIEDYQTSLASLGIAQPIAQQFAPAVIELLGAAGRVNERDILARLLD